MSKLPDKPSELLMAAVLDAMAIKDEPGYRLNMQQWHNGGDGRACEVCLAGSLMAKRLGAQRDRVAYPFQINGVDLPSETAMKLEAVNCMRLGYFQVALEAMRCAPTEPRAREAILKASRLVQDAYRLSRDGGRACWKDYREAARILAEAGL